MRKMDLEGRGQRIDYSSDAVPWETETPPPPTDADAPPAAEDDSGQLTNPILFGTLEIEGDSIYYAFLLQNKQKNVWILTDTGIFDAPVSSKQEHLIAVLSSRHTGSLLGWGKTYILTRLMTNISTMVYMCANNNQVDAGFFVTGEYSNERDGVFFRFQSTMSGRQYRKLEMVYDGFKLNLSLYNRKPPVNLPALLPVQDEKTKAAVVANLGIKTAATLFRQMGDRLAWFKKKQYTVITTDEAFQEMMVDFLNSVQSAHDAGKTVLVGLDTETTGLNMVNLSRDNKYRDSIVAIPFAWEDDKAFLICTDMFYFSNVSDEEVYPLFEKLFSRNPNYTFQDIELDYGGFHYDFNRVNITVSGWNVMFDERAFFTMGCDVFFDEDGRQLFFNLNTDLRQGELGTKKWGTPRIENSLKMQTRRLIGDETLELDELMGKGNEDKFRYLADEVLAKLYGGADADYTRLCVKIGRKMLEPNLYAQYRKYDMTTMYRMAKASWSGMPIDSEAVRKQGEQVLEDIKRIQEFVWHYAWLANRDTLNNKMDKVQKMLGLDSPADVEHALESDQMFRYAFTPNNHKRLLFDMLGYPVVKYSKQNNTPALDKFVLQKLSNAKRAEEKEVLKEHVYAVSDPSVILINKDDFNRDAYPLARVFTTYATLNKEYTSYYRPIMDNDMEGRMFYDITMARAATRRILSPGQTMKGSLKALVVAPPGQIFMSFDASQIEYRHMASLAYIRERNKLREAHPDNWEELLSQTNIYKVFNMMQKEEADYHIETAAAMTGVKQHEVTHKVRKRYKSIGFGIPYGLGERAMCESIHGGVVNEETLEDTRRLLSDFKQRQSAIIDLLEEARDNAFVPATISPEFREYMGIGDHHVGIVRNFTGFYRVFILENLTHVRTGRIRRQAGNCIIQGGAAELFRRMLYNFHVGCCKVGIQDKIHWLMTVHDELDATVDADIDIMLLIKVLYENCTLRYRDHIPYYIGINFGFNWEQAKDDTNELPVIMVQRMIKAYDDGRFSIPGDGNQASNLLKLKRHYLCDRVGEELSKIIPNLKAGHVWTEQEVEVVDKKFENYIVRAYLDVFAKGSMLDKLTAWQTAREEYGFGVDFLTTRFESGYDIELDLDTDFAADLKIDLLDNSPEEDSLAGSTEEVESTPWFGEDSLFDTSLSSDEIVDTDADLHARYTHGFDEEEEIFEENKNATNPFDIYKAKKYLRTKVLRIQDNVFSALLTGTIFSGKENILSRIIRKQFMQGAGTIVLIGESIIKVTGVDCSEDNLNWLDETIIAESKGGGQ